MDLLLYDDATAGVTLVQDALYYNTSNDPAEGPYLNRGDFHYPYPVGLYGNMHRVEGYTPNYAAPQAPAANASNPNWSITADGVLQAYSGAGYRTQLTTDTLSTSYTVTLTMTGAAAACSGGVKVRGGQDRQSGVVCRLGTDGNLYVYTQAPAANGDTTETQVAGPVSGLSYVSGHVYRFTAAVTPQSVSFTVTDVTAGPTAVVIYASATYAGNTRAGWAKGSEASTLNFGPITVTAPALPSVPAPPAGLTLQTVSEVWHDADGTLPQRHAVSPTDLSGSNPELAAPGGVAAALAAGGTLTVNQAYYYKVTTTNGGESTPSSEVTATPTAGNQTVNVSWTGVTGAAGYKVYRGTAAGGENLLVATITAPDASTAPATSFADNGVAGSSATPPAANTTGGRWGFSHPYAGALGQMLSNSLSLQTAYGNGSIPYLNKVAGSDGLHVQTYGLTDAAGSDIIAGVGGNITPTFNSPLCPSAAGIVASYPPWAGYAGLGIPRGSFQLALQPITQPMSCGSNGGTPESFSIALGGFINAPGGSAWIVDTYVDSSPQPSAPPRCWIYATPLSGTWPNVSASGPRQLVAYGYLQLPQSPLTGGVVQQQGAWPGVITGKGGTCQQSPATTTKVSSTAAWCNPHVALDLFSDADGTGLASHTIAPTRPGTATWSRAAGTGTGTITGGVLSLAGASNDIWLLNAGLSATIAVELQVQFPVVSGNQAGVAFGFDAAGQNGWVAYFDAPGGHLYLREYIGGAVQNAIATFNLAATANSALDYAVTATWDGTTANFYLNGAFVGSYALPAPLPGGYAGLWVNGAASAKAFYADAFGATTYNPTVLGSDTFGGTAEIAAHTADTGYTYSVQGAGTWSCNGSNVLVSNTGTNVRAAAHDFGKQRVLVEVDATNSNTDSGYLALAADGPNWNTTGNGWLFGLESSGRAVLYVVNGGVATAKATFSTAFTSGQKNHLAIRDDGTTISGWVNGVMVLSYATGITRYGTYCGFERGGANQTSADQYQNFKVSTF